MGASVAEVEITNAAVAEDGNVAKAWIVNVARASDGEEAKIPTARESEVSAGDMMKKMIQGPMEAGITNTSTTKAAVEKMIGAGVPESVQARRRTKTKQRSRGRRKISNRSTRRSSRKTKK